MQTASNLEIVHMPRPVERHGAFVMNTQEEINQAVSDFRSGRLA